MKIFNVQVISDTDYSDFEKKLQLEINRIQNNGFEAEVSNS